MHQPISVRFVHLRLVAVFLAALCAVQANAQGATKSGASQIAGELQLLKSFQTFERTVTGMDRFLTYGIVSSGGGWGVLEFVDTTSFATNSSVLRKSVSDYHLEVVRANAAIQRSKFAIEAEKRQAENIVASLDRLFDAVPAVADALETKDIASASQAYRDHGQGAYEAALRNTQSAVSGIQSRLQKTIRFQQKSVAEQLPLNDSSVERTLILQQSRLLKTYREFDQQTRHFHYVVVNALLSAYGDWRNLPDDYNATQAGLIDGVIDKMAPSVNRLKFRAAGFRGVSEEDAVILVASASKFQDLFEVGVKIRDLIYAEDIDAANLLYSEKALPLFETIWASNFTLISVTERRIPAR